MGLALAINLQGNTAKKLRGSMDAAKEFLKLNFLGHATVDLTALQIFKTMMIVEPNKITYVKLMTIPAKLILLQR
jgi:hypothetical protein